MMIYVNIESIYMYCSHGSTNNRYYYYRKSSISLFREDVLKKMSPTPPPFTRTKASASAEVWRSELVATLFLDFWLSSFNNESGVRNIVYLRGNLFVYLIFLSYFGFRIYLSFKHSIILKRNVAFKLTVEFLIHVYSLRKE